MLVLARALMLGAALLTHTMATSVEADLSSFPFEFQHSLRALHGLLLDQAKKRGGGGAKQFKLADDVQDFITQEAIHSREHHLLNNKIDRSKYPVDAIESEIRENIKFAYEGGNFRILMATICLEHFTAMMADLMMDLHTDYGPLFSKTDPTLERLWRWHAMEETEHKAVAYDVFLEATKDWSPLKRYYRRCMSMLSLHAC